MACCLREDHCRNDQNALIVRYDLLEARLVDLHQMRNVPSALEIQFSVVDHVLHLLTIVMTVLDYH
jgi:hypothetical protein